MNRHCECGRAISERATTCRWCRPYATRPLEDRFWRKVQKGPGCWSWIAGGDGPDGYGRIRQGPAGSPFLLTHRVAWELVNGPIPDGLMVLHHCDNPRCVRPDHLFLGTAADNAHDAQSKGRLMTGDRWYAARPSWKRRPIGPWTVANGRPRRTTTDPVTAAVRWAVMRRDGACVLSFLTTGHECHDRWGEVHPATATRALTVEHVKSELRMGKRAPSDIAHLVAMCHGANIDVPSKANRVLVREYLRSVTP